MGPELVAVGLEGYSGEEAPGRAGVPHGKGAAAIRGGHTYEGDFARGRMHGRGHYAWADGVQYVGEFEANAPEVRGPPRPPHPPSRSPARRGRPGQLTPG